MPLRPPNWTQIGGSGTPVSPSGGSLLPGFPSILDVRAIDTTDGGGNQQKQVTVLFLPPNPVGTFQSIEVWLDAPDTSGQLPIADGTQAADGNVAAAIGTFQPALIGDYTFDPNNLQIVFTVDAPAEDELARVYLTPGSKGANIVPVQHGKPGETPSFQFILRAAQPISAGREFAPLLLNPALAPTPAGWDANPNITVADSGDQFWEVSVQWRWPTMDQNIATLGGVNFVLDDGITQKYLGNIDYNTGISSFTLMHQTVRPGTISYRLWLISYSSGAKNNNLVSGVTPFVDFIVSRTTGPAGVEYTQLVVSDGVNPFVTAVTVAGADGSNLLHVTANWAVPTVTAADGSIIPDPTFGGAEIVALKPDGKYYSIAQGRLSPIANDVSNPATSQSWKFYLRSIDINNRRNTLEDAGPHTTPAVTITVGSNSGQLDLSKVMTGTFASGQFTVVSGAFTVTALSAGIVNTGILQVGGGGSKVSQLKIFDTLSSLIGWIGDDTGVSGFVGAWFKQIRIGGTSPSAANIIADTGGNTSFSLANGTIVINIDATNHIKVTDVSISPNQYIQLTGQTIQLSAPGVIPSAQITSQQLVFLDASGNTIARLYNASPGSGGILNLYDSSNTLRATLSSGFLQLFLVTGTAYCTIDNSIGKISLQNGYQIGGFDVLTANGVFATAGGLQLNVTKVSGAYTIAATDFGIHADATLGGFTIKLPASPSFGMLFRLVRLDGTGNVVVIDGNGHNIDGSATVNLLRFNHYFAQWDGTQWGV